MTQPDQDKSPTHSRTPGDERPKTAEVDMAALVDKVYRLMLAELRLERARGAAPGLRKKR
jgi:hypothetical protein